MRIETKKPVLVSGGAGYIGSHACKALSRSHYLPIAYDNLSRGHAHAVKWGPLVRGDILDLEALNRVFQEYRPQAVLHFAAFAYVGESVECPMTYYRNNFCGALNVVEATISHGCDLFVFSSTCAVYGPSRSGLISEDYPQAPMNPYGHSKRMVEQMLRDCDVSNGLRSVSLRYFNAAGADPDGEIGEEHTPETHAIPLILKAAAGEREVFEIYGTDYPTPDGTAIRDYVHVADLAEAHVAALRYLEAGGDTTALNLGTGRGFSVHEMIKHAEKVTGKPVPTKMTSRRPGDPAELVANPARSAEVLKLKMQHSRLVGMHT